MFHFRNVRQLSGGTPYITRITQIELIIIPPNRAVKTREFLPTREKR
jgi:hypothetical protein